MTVNASASANNFVNPFLEELAECFVTQQDDFISVPRATPYSDVSVTDADGRLTVPHYAESTVVNNDPSLDSFHQGGSSSNDNPALTNSNQGQEVSVDTTYNLTYARLKVLERLPKFVSKNSVIGRKIDSYFL